MTRPTRTLFHPSAGVVLQPARSGRAGLVLAALIALALAAVAIASLLLVDDPYGGGYGPAEPAGSETPATSSLPKFPTEPSIPPPAD